MGSSKEIPGILLRAVSFAAERHRHQRRKGVDADPYINHPIQVAEVLVEVGGIDDLPTLIAAILHDTVEDTATTLDELSERFGSEVAGLVGEVTDDKSLPKAERKRRQIEHAPALSAPAKRIKIADKICNVRDIAIAPPASWSAQRRIEYFAWSEAVVAGCSGASPALEAEFAECLARSRAAPARIFSRRSTRRSGPRITERCLQSTGLPGNTARIDDGVDAHAAGSRHQQSRRAVLHRLFSECRRYRGFGI